MTIAEAKAAFEAAAKATKASRPSDDLLRKAPIEVLLHLGWLTAESLRALDLIDALIANTADLTARIRVREAEIADLRNLLADARGEG